MTPIELVAWTAMTTLTIVSWVMTLMAYAHRAELNEQLDRIKGRLQTEETYHASKARDLDMYRAKYEALTEATKKIGIEFPVKGEK